MSKLTKLNNKVLKNILHAKKVHKKLTSLTIKSTKELKQLLDDIQEELEIRSQESIKEEYENT